MLEDGFAGQRIEGRVRCEKVESVLSRRVGSVDAIRNRWWFRRWRPIYSGV